MEISVASILILLFLLLFAFQMFLDAAFMFLCYITGVLALKLVTLLNTKYDTLSYGVFKDTYKTNPVYKKPMAVGFILWILFIVIILAF